jgi:hypothetical protein
VTDRPTTTFLRRPYFDHVGGSRPTSRAETWAASIVAAAAAAAVARDIARHLHRG